MLLNALNTDIFFIHRQFSRAIKVKKIIIKRDFFVVYFRPSHFEILLISNFVTMWHQTVVIF